MKRSLILAMILATAFTTTSAMADSTTGKTKLLGHLSDKDEPVATTEDTQDEPTAVKTEKDPNFIPVSKLGEYPNEPAPIDVVGRERDAGSDKLRNIP